MRYPGRIIRKGELDSTIVRAVKLRLNEVLAIDSNADLRLDPDDPNFGPKMEYAVKFFQARNVDADGHPLNQDGELGPNSWAALFGDAAVYSSTTARDPFLARVLQTASGEEAKHVREVPKDSNRGPEVEAYLARAGAAPGNSWCRSRRRAGPIRGGSRRLYVSSWRRWPRRARRPRRSSGRSTGSRPHGAGNRRTSAGSPPGWEGPRSGTTGGPGRPSTARRWRSRPTTSGGLRPRISTTRRSRRAGRCRGRRRR